MVSRPSCTAGAAAQRQQGRGSAACRKYKKSSSSCVSTINVQRSSARLCVVGNQHRLRPRPLAVHRFLDEEAVCGTNARGAPLWGRQAAQQPGALRSAQAPLASPSPPHAHSPPRSTSSTVGRPDGGGGSGAAYSLHPSPSVAPGRPPAYTTAPVSVPPYSGTPNCAWGGGRGQGQRAVCPLGFAGGRGRARWRA